MEKLPETVANIVSYYLQHLNRRMPDALEGFYLYGSVSLGAFCDGLSDIDFIAVLQKRPFKSELNVLKGIHKEMRGKFPKTDFSGLYVTCRDLCGATVNVQACPLFVDGKCKGLRRFDHNSIDAYQLKAYGITVLGEDCRTLPYEVDWDVLTRRIRDNLNTYWRQYIDDCKRFPNRRYLGMRFSQRAADWGVLGITRLYYSLVERDIISKVAAGNYALQNLPDCWHPILREALRERTGDKAKYFPSSARRYRDAIGYMEYIIAQCNTMFL